MSIKHVFLPAQFVIDAPVYGNRVRQLRRASLTVTATVDVYRLGPRTKAHLLRWKPAPDSDEVRTLIVAKSLTPPADVHEVLITKGGAVPESEDAARAAGARWLTPAALDSSKKKADEWATHCEAICASWQDQFGFRMETVKDGKIVQEGLRPPQIGALHAVLSRWTVTRDPGTVVLPTGTGKTETMLALLVSHHIERLMVVVPNKALREQIAHKFLTLGLLKRLGVVGPAAAYPVVGVLEHRPKSPEEAEAIFARCNVIVTNIQVAGGCDESVQRRMSELCSHLFIDEAHHVPAESWARLRRFFLSKAVLQFTATPFRTDGKHVDGDVVFNYPLRKAQEEEYFRPITFRPITEFSTERSDERIAELAVAQLTADEQKGFFHLAMARTSSIPRAKTVHAIYQRIAPDYAPILIHSKTPQREQAAALSKLRTGQSRIVVCVDMFGEGFDLPELKIAALHDMHKSLAITLQFTGRFTRTKPRLGSATMIANIADAVVEGAIRDLYAEDSDWNHILRLLSEGATKQQEQRSEFLGGFEDVPSGLPLQNVFPKMSAVVYRTRRNDWTPEAVKSVIKEPRLYAGPTVHRKARLFLFVAREQNPIPWGDIKDLRDTTWDLYLVYWDRKRKLLFINSSNNDSLHEDIAKAVAGDDVEAIKGETVFRGLHGINRMALMNLGLKTSLSRAVRFVMYTGNDIKDGLSEALASGKLKSNLFGIGFENGAKVTFGCSQKGRVWSYKIAYDMAEWIEWCRSIGTKLLDDSISTQAIFNSIIVPTQISQRPDRVPLTIEWSEDFLERNSESVTVHIGGEAVPFFEVGMQMTDHRTDGPLMFRIFTDTTSATYEVQFNENSVEYVPVQGDPVEVEVSRRRKTLNEWFQKEPPVIRFADSAFLIYNNLCDVAKGSARTPFDASRLSGWDWTGTDLTKESQRTTKRTDSIQYKVIREILSAGHDPDFDIVFDDDSSGEAADIVGIKAAADQLIVHLYHLKYSHSADPGARVADLYEVCGQAQRSVYWKSDVRGLLTHLRNREALRQREGQPSRFERGDLNRLLEIHREAPYLTADFKVFIVQPGVSKASVTTDQLDLLGATELYLKETYGIGLEVVTSA